MVTQTRQMARSALRSAFLESQSRRHQTRSVARITAEFLSSSHDAPPPVIAQYRARKRRSSEREQEEEENVRPAKARRRVAAAPAPDSPIFKFPVLPRQSLKPPATAEQVSQAEFTLEYWREVLHDEHENLSQHEPGYQGRRKDPSYWELDVPDMEAVEEDLLDRRGNFALQRKEERALDVPRTPKQLLDRRLGRKENENVLWAKRKQVVLDKAEFVAEYGSLNAPHHIRNSPWNRSTLKNEIGWEWKGDDLYQHSRDASILW
ncbi:hypothetical protein VTL71DRAFT_8722 [Oculimacula yallundae]|uniref:Uncharacterized protein n=1 Tax=Oculimacula yallundae TaxID=86028 RepID=A0ABR4CZE4_9HELO